VTLTALALEAGQISDGPLPPTQPGTDDENFLTVYRDAGGPSPSDFNPGSSTFSTTGWGLSVLQQPQRNKRWIAPFTVIYREPLMTGTIGVVADDTFVGFMGNPVPIVYSPPDGSGGHWTLQAPADSTAQGYKAQLANYGKLVKKPSGIP
jgi:type II secretory pathway pseudopilin PulG